MSSFPIDTQEVADRLTEAGVPDQQAKAHAYVLLDSLRLYDTGISTRMCSKMDLSDAIAPVLRSITDLQAATARLDAKIDSASAKLKGEILTWIISIGFLQGGLSLALLLNVWP